MTLEETLSKTLSIDKFLTILGVIVFGFGVKQYITFYLNGVISLEMSILLIILMVMGYVFFITGLSNWKERHDKEQELEDRKREAEKLKKEIEIKKHKETLKRLNS